MPTTITDYYAKDHDRLDGLFKSYQQFKRSDFPKAKEAFVGFKFGLQRHIIWEEDILFPLFEKKMGLTNQPQGGVEGGGRFARTGEAGSSLESGEILLSPETPSKGIGSGLARPIPQPRGLGGAPEASPVRSGDASPLYGPTAVMRTEHRQIKAALEAIHTQVAKGSSATDLEEAALFSVLYEHNVKEEKILYPAIDQSVTEAETKEIFRKMETVPREPFEDCC